MDRPGMERRAWLVLVGSGDSKQMLAVKLIFVYKILLWVRGRRVKMKNCVFGSDIGKLKANTLRLMKLIKTCFTKLVIQGGK